MRSAVSAGAWQVVRTCGAHRLVAAVAVACLWACCHAQAPIDSAYLAQLDSLLQDAERREKVRTIIRQFEEARLAREQKFDYMCFVPLLRGGITAAFNRDFIRHEGVVPAKSSGLGTADYAVAAVPLATAWAMKAAGVQSRSTTERMASATAMSMAMTFGLSNGMKAIVSEQRPDGSNSRSMPSGHSALAFASAAILAREYSDVSPWIGVGAYTTATATQYLRMRHSRHWESDIYMGVGIGLLSTNLGYLLTDKLLAKDGIAKKPEVRLRDMQRVARFNNQPSGVTMLSGAEFGDHTFAIDNVDVKAMGLFTVGADLSWFLTQTFAVELMAHSTTGFAKVYGPPSYAADDILMHHLDVAGKYSLPYELGKRVSARAFAGMRHVDALSFASDEAPLLAMPRKTTFEAGCGFDYEAIDRNNYAAGFACDYVHSFAGIMRNRFCISTVWKVIF